MKTRLIIGALMCFFGSVLPVSAGVTLFAEAPASASVGADIPVRLKARMTESINALRMTVLVGPETVDVLRFDDADSVIRLWLQRGTPVEGGVVLEGVIPGGIGPAFTDVADLGTLWVRAASPGSMLVWFEDAKVYLNQPTPSLSEVSSSELTIRVAPAGQRPPPSTFGVTVTDSDIRIVKEPALYDGRRTLLFDIKTDRGTVDTVRVRERWFGLLGVWRDASSPSTLSDAWGLSILDVALPDAIGGARVGTVVPALLKVIWGAAAVILLASVIGYLKRRH